MDLSLHSKTCIRYLRIVACGCITIDITSILEARHLRYWKLHCGELQLRSQELSVLATTRLQYLPRVAEVGVYDENLMPIVASKPAICWLQSIGFRQKVEQNSASVEENIDWETIDSITLEFGPTYLMRSKAKRTSLHNGAAEQSKQSVEVPSVLLDDQEKAVSKAKSVDRLMSRSFQHQFWLLSGSYGSRFLEWSLF